MGGRVVTRAGRTGTGHDNTLGPNGHEGKKSHVNYLFDSQHIFYFTYWMSFSYKLHLTRWWICQPNKNQKRIQVIITTSTWWRHQLETVSALLALCAENSPVTGEFPSQRAVTQSFHVSFDLRLSKRLSKQSRRRWFETPWRSLWRHWNVLVKVYKSLPNGIISRVTGNGPWDKAWHHT